MSRQGQLFDYNTEEVMAREALLECSTTHFAIGQFEIRYRSKL
jgi:hypothetical protein